MRRQMAILSRVTSILFLAAAVAAPASHSLAAPPWAKSRSQNSNTSSRSRSKAAAATKKNEAKTAAPKKMSSPPAPQAQPVVKANISRTPRKTTTLMKAPAQIKSGAVTRRAPTLAGSTKNLAKQAGPKVANRKGRFPQTTIGGAQAGKFTSRGGSKTIRPAVILPGKVNSNITSRLKNPAIGTTLGKGPRRGDLAGRLPADKLNKIGELPPRGTGTAADKAKDLASGPDLQRGDAERFRPTEQQNSPFPSVEPGEGGQMSAQFINLDDVGEAFEDFVEDPVGTTTDAVEDVADWVEETAEEVVDELGDIAEEVIDETGDVFDATEDFVNDRIDEARDQFDDFLDQIGVPFPGQYEDPRDDNDPVVDNSTNDNDQNDNDNTNENENSNDTDVDVDNSSDNSNDTDVDVDVDNDTVVDVDIVIEYPEEEYEEYEHDHFSDIIDLVIGVGSAIGGGGFAGGGGGGYIAEEPVYEELLPEAEVTVDSVLDLALTDVRLVEPAFPALSQGPRYRVTVTNYGSQPAENFLITLVAAIDLATEGNHTLADKSVLRLAAGATQSFDVRLPAEALTLQANSGRSVPFAQLLVLIDREETTADIDRENNTVVLEAADIARVDLKLLATDRSSAVVGSSLTVIGEGFHESGSRVWLAAGGKRIEAKIVESQATRLVVAVPRLRLQGTLGVELSVTGPDGTTSEPLPVLLTPVR